MSDRVIRVIEREPEPPRDPSGRPPPNDHDAEAAVISAVFGDPRRLAVVRDLLEPDDFFDDRNRIVFESVVALAELGRPIDVVTVGAWLRDRQLLGRVDVRRLGELIDATPAVGNVAEHARAVRRLKLRRRAIVAGQRFAAEGYDRVDDAQGYLDDFAAELGSIADAGQKLAGGGVTLAKSTLIAMGKAHDGIEFKPPRGVSTGISALDDKTAGLHRKEMITLSARTGGGKTALAGDIAEAVAAAGHGVVIFSLEMPHEQLSTRLACAAGRVDWHKVRKDEADHDDYAGLIRGTELIRKLPIIIDDDKPMTVRQLHGKARRYAEELDKTGTPLRLIVVDYVQKLRGGGIVSARATRERELFRIAEMQIKLVESMGVTMIGLAQETEEGLIRDCKGIGHESHAWWRLVIDRKGDDVRVATIQIKKQRHGPHPTIASCYFHAPYVLFSDCEVLR